jgi:hypothetical protein
VTRALTAEEWARVEARQRDPNGAARREREAEDERTTDLRLWAAVALTPDLNACRSILEGRPALARQLDPVVLRRALRGARLPSPESYISVAVEMLDAVAEGGAFTPKGRRR